MRKYFDCLSCDNSFTDEEGKVLFCTIRKEQVSESNICLNHTELDYNFPNAMETAFSKQFYEDSTELLTILEEKENTIK